MASFETDTTSEKERCYPNTDSSVWLRSCEKEVKEPIEGKVEDCGRELKKIAAECTQWWKWYAAYPQNNGLTALQSTLDNGGCNVTETSGATNFTRFAISHGRVTYQCRFLQSTTYKKNHLANRIVVTEFGTESVADPCHTIFDRFSAIFTPAENLSDNAMISVYPFGDEIYAFSESPVIHRIDPETLDTISKRDVSRNIAVANHTSHPHVMKNGDVYNLGMAVGKLGISYGVLHFPAAKKERMFDEARILARIPTRWPLHPGYMHTFGITDNYYIIVEQPLSISLFETVKAQIYNAPLSSSFRWYPEHYTLIHVINRSDGLICRTFCAEAFFYLHIINQYEDDDHIVIDICCYKDPSVIEAMYIESIRTMQLNPDYAKMFRNRPLRFVLPLNGENVTLENTTVQAEMTSDGQIFIIPELLNSIGCETPRINYEKYLGKKYRYFYAIGSDVDTQYPGIVIKVDTFRKTRIVWREENCYPSEPIFVPSPDSKEEDDGVLLSALIWGQERTREVGVIVLDAKTLKEIGRATFNTPSDVPKCLHGWFLPNADI